MMGNEFSNASSGCISSPQFSSQVPFCWPEVKSHHFKAILGLSTWPFWLQCISQNADGPWFWSWNRFQSWLQVLKALWRIEGFRDGTFLLCSQLPPELTKMVSLTHLTKPAGTHLEGTPDTLLQTWNTTKDSLLIGWKPSDSCWKIKSYGNAQLFNRVSC